MLVLTRRVDETLYIGSRIRVTVTHLVPRGAVRLQVDDEGSPSVAIRLRADRPVCVVDGVVLHHCGANSRAVRIGIDAPRDVAIEREECRGRYAARAVES